MLAMMINETMKGIFVQNSWRKGFPVEKAITVKTYWRLLKRNRDQISMTPYCSFIADQATFICFFRVLQVLRRDEPLLLQSEQIDNDLVLIWLRYLEEHLDESLTDDREEYWRADEGAFWNKLIKLSPCQCESHCYRNGEYCEKIDIQILFIGETGG